MTTPPLPVFGLLDRGCISQNSPRLNNMPLIKAVCFNLDILAEQGYSPVTGAPFRISGGGEIVSVPIEACVKRGSWRLPMNCGFFGSVHSFRIFTLMFEGIPWQRPLLPA